VLLIIAGAGASYDSDWRRLPAGDAPGPAGERQMAGTYFRPPLAAQIFDEERFGSVVAQYAPSQGLMVRLRNAAPAVEQELEAIRTLSTTQEHIPRQLLAIRYYLRHVVGGSVEGWVKARPDRMTNFTRLVGGLEPWRQASGQRVAIATFNYDTLFEEALSSTLPRLRLWQPQDMNDYISDGRYQVFKLHGSTNWWRFIQAEWVQRVGMSNPVGWASTMFDPLGPYTEEGAFNLNEGAVLPCVPSLAIPMATKTDSDFACPAEHLNELRTRLGEVTDVLIIGWRGIEQHFLEMWRLVHATKKDPRINTIAVVDRSIDAGQEVVARVTHHVGLTPSRDRYYETFSRFVNEKLNEYLDIL
jgi:hypothetical protein